MNIQTYSEDKAREIAELFYQSVHAVDSLVYTAAQKDAWAPAPIDYVRWSERLAIKNPFLAIIRGRVAGFIELDADGHIDGTYTHPDYQGIGVASALYEHLLKEANIRNINRLYVEASLIAKPFFEKRGFSVVKKNEVDRQGVSLVNFSMEKYLGDIS
ncbi:GNAT family N-acetyltransferase [Celerinatantimonas sp. YJH-8]|uniref:GNAT family N-acetyltransferase n=1 Tax=Celerinatantimonas sp. YJH-8 TaxID=3228714 RepID=UPI0038BF3B0C